MPNIHASTRRRSAFRFISFITILVLCFVVTTPIAPRLLADAWPYPTDCNGRVQHIDDPPCPLCETIRIVDESDYCYARGHYEDSCTHEITGYWIYAC